MMTFISRVALAAILIFGVSVPLCTYAATIRVTPQGEMVGAGNQMVISVLLETDTSAVNAVEGALSIPEGVQVDAVETAGSAFSLWITHPQYSRGDGTIAFSGGVPGGIASHEQALLFTVHAHADMPGTYVFTPRDITAYRNDGAGTKETSVLSSASVTVDTSSGAQTASSHESGIALAADVGSDPSLFDGALFLSFYGGDNGSGVLRYEVKEGWFSGYQEVDRYYVLKDQSRSKGITVRAYRADDTKTTLHVPAEHVSGWLILVLAVLVIGGGWLVWKKKRTSHAL